MEAVAVERSRDRGAKEAEHISHRRLLRVKEKEKEKSYRVWKAAKYWVYLDTVVGPLPSAPCFVYMRMDLLLPDYYY